MPRPHKIKEPTVTYNLNMPVKMKNFLIEKGLKVPLTGVVHSQVVPDTFSVAKALDFTAENAYYEHPIFEPGKAWRSVAYYKNKNYFRQKLFRNIL